MKKMKIKNIVLKKRYIVIMEIGMMIIIVKGNIDI